MQVFIEPSESGAGLEVISLKSTFATALYGLLLGLDASDDHLTVDVKAAIREATLSSKMYEAGVMFAGKYGASLATQTWESWLVGWFK